MENKDPIISVIVPVYKVEAYLSKCIDSILAQTFTDFELLLVDDGSPDRAGAICDWYAEKDRRIRVFHKSNGGLSSARNCGLDNAKGEWIAFVDSDDYVGKDYLKELYKDVRPCIDLVVHCLRHIRENGDEISYGFKTSEGKCIYDFSEFKKMIQEQNLCLRPHAVSKLYNRDIIELHHLRFLEDVVFGEDYMFLFSYLNFTLNKVLFSSTSSYYYVDRSESIVHSKKTFNQEFLIYQYAKSITKPLMEKYNCSIEDFDVMYFFHRAITVAKSKAELQKIPSEDWILFCKYFKVITKKTALDKWVVKHFYTMPTILFFYLHSIRSFRELLEKRNLWSIVDFLRK